MTSLWSRENRKGLALYVDLFEDVPNEYEEQFKKWNQRLQHSNWKHTFLDLKNDAFKAQTVADDFERRGNEYFLRKEFHKAMELYNQALCFVLFNSSQMGLLYGKRGFCFFNLNMFAESMADAELALSTNLPLQMVPKLEECRANSEQLMLLPRRAPIIPKLSFDADTTFPCMTNVLEIHQNDGLESYIVAKTDIEIGQIVLMEAAFTSIAVGFDTAVCFTCLKTCRNLIPCMSCTEAMFCNLECMQRNKVHEISCGEAYHRMPSYIKFVIQSILEAIVSFESIDDLIKFVKDSLTQKDIEIETNTRILNYGLFFGLKSSTKPLPIQLIYEAYTTLMKIPKIESQFSTKSKQRFLMHLVGHHVQILLKNSYGGFEKDQNHFIIASMTNVASLVQHSCTPNLIQYIVGNQTIFITNQPVKEGDHLYIDYCPEEDTEQRKEILMANFGIVCTCAKCQPQQPTIDLKLSNDASLLFISHYTTYMGCGTSALLKQKCVKFLQQHKHLPWTKEKEMVIKVFTQCVLDEFSNK